MHGNVRIGECITSPALKMLNDRDVTMRAEMSRQIQQACGITGFNLYGPLTEINPTSGEKNKKEWSSMMYPELKKLVRRFDVSLAYGWLIVNNLLSATEDPSQRRLAWRLWGIVSLAMDRGRLETGGMSTNSLIILFYCCLQLWMHLTQQPPTAVRMSLSV